MGELELQKLEQYSTRGVMDDGGRWPGGCLAALQLACAEIRRLKAVDERTALEGGRDAV